LCSLLFGSLERLLRFLEQAANSRYTDIDTVAIEQVVSHVILVGSRPLGEIQEEVLYARNVS
jgi:hypothetical protein